MKQAKGKPMIATQNSSPMRSKNVMYIVLATAIILLIPLVAMQFTNEVKWGATDFVVIGSLLLGTGLVYQLVAGRLGSTTQRVIFGIVLLAALILMWAELAVGIFGTPFSGS